MEGLEVIIKLSVLKEGVPKSRRHRYNFVQMQICVCDYTHTHKNTYIHVYTYMTFFSEGTMAVTHFISALSMSF